MTTALNGTPNEGYDVNTALVYENDSYKVVVGEPPRSREFPYPLSAYLVINKKFGVCEHINQMQVYATSMADELDNVLRNGFPKKNTEEEVFPKQFR